MCRTDLRVLMGCIIGFAASVLPSLASAADIIVGVNVPAAQQKPLSSIDHGPWDALLRTYVDDHGRVNYRDWKQSSADVQALDQYLKQLSYSNGEGSKEEKLAFWINAYNALTIKGILREYPTSSIRNHTAKVFGYNIWKNLKLVVGARQVSLDEMEHQILRKMGEPRIHFAIVCASIGCPRLLNEAYRAETLDQQLTVNATAFFSDETKFRYDPSQQVFYVSPILDWFGDDFGGSDAAKLKRMSAWIARPEIARIATTGRGTVDYMEYDWGLNAQK